MKTDNIEPWKIKITRINLAEQVDLEEIANEIHMLHCLSSRESMITHEVTCDEFPLITQLRDGLITDAVITYCKEAFDITPENLKIDTFGKWFEKGKHLGPHLHGNSNVTSVFYPFDYESGMTLHDPRFNACRGYSRRVRDSHFGDFYVNPKGGDLWIMPSYIMHNVPPVSEDLRVSLINDFHFE